MRSKTLVEAFDDPIAFGASFYPSSADELEAYLPREHTSEALRMLQSGMGVEPERRAVYDRTREKAESKRRRKLIRKHIAELQARSSLEGRLRHWPLEELYNLGRRYRNAHKITEVRLDDLEHASDLEGYSWKAIGKALLELDAY